MLAASRLGQTRTFASETWLNGYRCSTISATTAVSACISPSTARSGRRCAHDLGGAAHLLGLRVSDAAEVREREHRDARLGVELASQLGHQDRGLGQVFGRRVDVHRRIGQEVRAGLDAAAGDLLGQQDVGAAGPPDALAHPDDLERRPDHRAVVVGQAGEERVGVALLDHHQPEVVRA